MASPATTTTTPGLTENTTTPYDALTQVKSALAENLEKMLFTKTDSNCRSQLPELITQTSVSFLALRQINRIILQEEDRIKQETEAVKSPVDYKILQLNNLLYQKAQYIKHIGAYRDFKSRYPDIELISEEAFFRDAPIEFKKDVALNKDARKTMLERLNYELYQRKELYRQRELMEARKKMLQETLADQRKFLSSLPSHLRALKKASLPVQQQLGLQHTQRMKQHQLTELLPTPLYVIYIQILAYKEAFDDNIELEIIGSANDAHAISLQQALKDSGLLFEKMNEEIKLGECLQEEYSSIQIGKKPRKSNFKEISVEGIYHRHPLSVLWHIYDENGKSMKLMSLRFEHLMKLNIVCAGVECAEDGSASVLSHLFPDDTGLELPTEASKLSAGMEFKYDVTRQLHPYKWVQHLAGVDFLAEQSPLLDGLSPGENLKGSLIRNSLLAHRRQHRVQTILEKLRHKKNLI